MNLSLAETILFQTYRLAKENIEEDPQDSLGKSIALVLNGTHKTYKYIMVNAFLAKATDPNINPLCLQKQSAFDGAYDARSLCHKVLVKFEREHLSNALGGSNEPFLNKPARFPELSPSNAVRSGQDRKVLQLLCQLLPQISDSETALLALSYSMYHLLKIARQKKTTAALVAEKDPTYLEIDHILNELVEKSFRGESLVLAVGILMNMHALSWRSKTKVETHVVNQAGSSSKEVGDIDFYVDGILAYAIEVKDKTFTPEDVGHAINKAADNNCSRFTFVFGPRVYPLEDFQKIFLVNQAHEKGILLNLIGFNDFKKMILSIISPVTTDAFFGLAKGIVEEARMRQDTLQHLLAICQSNGILK